MNRINVKTPAPPFPPTHIADVYLTSLATTLPFPCAAQHNSIMTHIANRIRAALVGFALAAACALASDLPTVQRVGPLGKVSDDLRQAVEDRGYRVTLDSGWSAEFWFARQPKLESKNAPAALYPELSDGQFIAIANFPAGISDYRGQQIPAGLYTLRYQTLPQDGNHLGVSPNPDFLLAIPIASDAHPEQNYAFKKLVTLSAKSTGTGHPAVIAMDTAATPGALTKNDHGDLVFSVAIVSHGGKTETLGIVLQGTAAQ